MHLVQADGRKVLLDCGLFQGRRAEARERNTHFPFKPNRLDAVVLSHAHIDHCGNLPNLIRQGYRGPIYCTPATRDLLSVMLGDSAKIQEEDAAYLNRKRARGEPALEPLYTRRDVYLTMRQVQPVPYERPAEVAKGVQIRFVDAGHLLGSAMVALTINTTGRDRTLTFTGDLGRRGLPILRDPAPVPPAEFLISESTYGGERHEPVDLLADSLATVIQRTFDRGGKLLIPAFSLGRTQAIVYFLHQLISAGRLPELPVFVDSPLAANATHVFRMNPDCFDDETADLLADHPELFGEQHVRYVENVEESIRLNHRKEPCIIIAASGMCEAGRILHHLKHNVEDARNTVLIVGFQAPDTLGHRLVQRRPEVRILGRVLYPRAEIAIMSGFSSHADQDDFDTFLGPLAGETKQVCLVHGEVDRAEALATRLRELKFPAVTIPDRGETINLA